MDATSESRDENAAPTLKREPTATSKPNGALPEPTWAADGPFEGAWSAFESPQSVYAVLLGATPGSLLPPPPISTSGLLPSPTASSLLLQQLQLQAQMEQSGGGGGGVISGADGGGNDLPFFTALSPHPHHPALLSPLHAAMGFGAASPSGGIGSSLSMADMMADPMLLFTQPSPTASMLKHLLPPFASPLHQSSAQASASSASAQASIPQQQAAVSPSILMSVPPAPANVKDMTLNELRPHFNKPMAVVAKELGVCITLMKKICRRNGLVRWPHRRIRSLVNRITSLQVIAASAAGAEKKRFQAQIAALREELSAVIQNPNEKSRKAQADARNRFFPDQVIPTTAEVNASMSAMLRDCGGDMALPDDDNDADEHMEAAVRPEPLQKKADQLEEVVKMEPELPVKSPASETKAKKKTKKSKKATKDKKRELDTAAAVDGEEDDESPRGVSDLADPSPALSSSLRPGKKRKRVGRCFGSALPPPPIKIPRLDEQSSTRARCHSAPERRVDKKRALRSSDRLNSASSGLSPASSHCVRPATTTNRGKRGSISSILCHSEI